MTEEVQGEGCDSTPGTNTSWAEIKSCLQSIFEFKDMAKINCLQGRVDTVNVSYELPR